MVQAWLFFLLSYLYGSVDATYANSDATQFRFPPELVNTNNTCYFSHPDCEPPARRFVNGYWLSIVKPGVFKSEKVLPTSLDGNIRVAIVWGLLL